MAGRRRCGMTVEVRFEKDEWCTRRPDPEDPWDNGSYDGRVSRVEAVWVEKDPDPVGWRSSLFGADGAVPGDTVFVVVADHTSGSTFGTSAGSAEVLDVFKSPVDAFALAVVAETFTEAARRSGTLAAWRFEHGGRTYYANWLGYFEVLKEVRVWDCLLRPASLLP
jgi:hypothetical protein